MALFLVFNVILHVCLSIDPTKITDVHIIFSSHLDCGFTDTISNVLDLYWNDLYNNAIQTNNELINYYNITTYKYMTHSWLLSLLYDCPQNIDGLTCLDAASSERIKLLIQNGNMWFHAFPFNSLMELYDESMISFGIQLSIDMANELGIKPSKVISQRDVPGMTRSIIPVLKSNGITAISIGVNPNSANPDVPLISRWKDPVSNEEILLLQWPGYGFAPPNGPPLELDGFDHVLIFQFNWDNAGPNDSPYVASVYQTLAQMYPNANVYSSTIDDYVDLVLADQALYNSLPVYTEEIGETWCYGNAADPLKMAKFRIAQKWRTEYIKNGLCSLDSPNFYNFSRFLLKNGEHTFGINVNKWLNSQEMGWYNNTILREKLDTNDFQILVNSWFEQRTYGIDYALDALKESNNSNDVELYKTIANEFMLIENPTLPENFDDANIWQPINISETFRIKLNNTFDIKFSGLNGALVKLYDLDNDLAYINYTENSKNDLPFGFAGLMYQTRTEQDFHDFYYNYTYDGGSDCVNDFCKNGLNANTNGLVKHQNILSSYIQGYKYYNENIFAIKTDYGSYQDDLYYNFGAPQYSITIFDFTSQYQSNKFNINVTLYNKTFTRIPEAIWVTFHPNQCTNIYVRKIEEYIDINDVIKNGTKHLHSVGIQDGNIKCFINENDNNIQITGIDAPLTGFMPQGWPNLTPFATPIYNTTNDITKPFGFILMDNTWETNYPIWYPYTSNDNNTVFRFNIQLQ